MRFTHDLRNVSLRAYLRDSYVKSFGKKVFPINVLKCCRPQNINCGASVYTVLFKKEYIDAKGYEQFLFKKRLKLEREGGVSSRGVGWKPGRTVFRGPS